MRKPYNRITQMECQEMEGSTLFFLLGWCFQTITVSSESPFMRLVVRCIFLLGWCFQTITISSECLCHDVSIGLSKKNTTIYFLYTLYYTVFDSDISICRKHFHIFFDTPGDIISKDFHVKIMFGSLLDRTSLQRVITHIRVVRPAF